ncbi:TPA: hypothetical protein JLF01_002047 [Escherichia coli]|nr:hypothetical protein [Salmonella enterica]EJB2155553.1 hypothetical protein [Salmonella enterica]EKC3963452.1 hypothetical protein [Salmonella enterica subsp. enterica]HAV9081099.1 hypothetical protein [Escherichia coli]
MNSWFISYKVIHHNGGVYEQYEIFDTDSTKSANEVLDEALDKIAQANFTQPERVMVVSFNRV